MFAHTPTKPIDLDEWIKQTIKTTSFARRHSILSDFRHIPSEKWFHISLYTHEILQSIYRRKAQNMHDLMVLPVMCLLKFNVFFRPLNIVAPLGPLIHWLEF